MKKDFLTGFALLLPVIITIAILTFVVNILTNPFLGPVKALFQYYGLLDRPFLFFSSEQLVNFASRLAILLSLFVIIMFVGFLGRWVFIHLFFNIFEGGIRKIPFISKIHKAFHDVVSTVFSQKKESKFSEVVLVPFPHENVRSIGLVTSQSSAEESDAQYQEMVSVFVPGTPNPAMGFMLLFRKEQLTRINMKVSDALKFLVSCGVIVPEDIEDNP